MQDGFRGAQYHLLLEQLVIVIGYGWMSQSIAFMQIIKDHEFKLRYGYIFAKFSLVMRSWSKR